MDLGFNELATGGLLAAAAVAGSFWRNLKTAFSYVSSFAIVRIQITPMLGVSVRRYLKATAKTPNLGTTYILGQVMNIPSVAAQSIVVPFSIKADASFWFYRRTLIWVRFDNSHILINAIRGTFDVEQLVKDALEYELKDRRQSASRFYLRRVLGAEKGAWAGNRKDQRVSHGDSGSPQPEVVESSGTNATIDLGVDVSFMYPQEVMNEAWKTRDPFEHLYFDKTIQGYIEQAKQWMALSDWYRERSIPWRRGWLLYGPGGSGKSSFAKAIAQSLRIPLYHYHLSTLSDREYIDAWTDMDTPCVALLEDFDTVFHGREPQTEHSSLSFECVLNTLSGVSSNDGVFLIITTNHLEHIDPAIGVKLEGSSYSTRPGRVDNVIYLGHMAEPERRKLAQQILRDWPEDVENLVAQHTQVSPIQFQEACLQLAFSKLALHDLISIGVKHD